MEYSLRHTIFHLFSINKVVLILILMEYSLRHQESQFVKKLKKSLNPYSNGI